MTRKTVTVSTIRQGIETLNRDNPGVIMNIAVQDGEIVSGGSGIGDVAGPATTTANKVPQWDTTNKKLKDGLTVGTGALNLVQMTAASKLPAVDGSLLTNLPSGSGDVVGPAGATDSAVVQFNTTTGKLIKSGPSIGTAANNLVQLSGTATLPAVDGSSLTGSLVKGPSSVTADTLAQFDATTGKLLKQGPVLGTAANNVVQLNGSAQLPAVDGSLLTGVGTVARYQACATATKEVFVTASATGITAAWGTGGAAYDLTFTIPDGVKLLSVVVQNPASSGTFTNTLYLDSYATGDGWNTSWKNRGIPSVNGVTISTGAATSSTVNADTTDMTKITVTGLDDTLATYYHLSF